MCTTRIRTAADLDDLRVGERFEGVLGLGERMDRHGQSVFEREAPVPREMVGVGVRLEHPLDPNTARLGRLQVLLDVKGGSTTTATPASGSPTRYEAHPRSSSTNCRKSSTAPEVNSRRRRSEPDVQRDEERDQSQAGADHRNDQGRLAERASPVVRWACATTSSPTR